MKSLWSIFLGAVIVSSVNAVKGRPSCAEVRRAFFSKGIGPMKIVPYRAITTNKLQICPSEMPTCCNRRMETRYQLAARDSLAQTLEDNFNILKAKFSKFLKEFEDDYQELLMKSKEEIINKLNSTYFEMSELNLQNVNLLFEELLLSRIRNSNQDLSTIKSSLERLFLHLFASTFKQQSEIQSTKPEQRNCIASQIEKTPYKEVISDLVQSVSMFRNLTNEFLKAVQAGVEILSTPAKSFIDSHCEESLVRMQHCSHCYGLTLIKPCENFCRNVMRGCLVGLSEIDRFWKYYVIGLNDVIERMSKEESDPQTVLNDVTNSVNLFANLILSNKTINEIKQECFDSSTRPKRSADGVNEEPKQKKRHRGRRQRDRSTRDGKQTGDAETESGMEQDKVSPRRIIPPPHEMLLWEPSLALKRGKKQNGKKRKNEKQIVEQSEQEGALLQPEMSRLNLKSKIKRFVAHLDLYSRYFSNLPDDICNEYDSGFGTSMHGSCWDGKSISTNYTLPVVKYGWPYQQANPEVQVTKVGVKTIEIIQKLKKNGITLMTLAGKHQFPNDLKTDFSDVIIRFDESDTPCDDDEDHCADLGSGLDFVLEDLPKNKGLNRKHKNRNKHRRKKGHSKNKSFDSTLNIMAEVDNQISDLVQAEDKTILSSSQGGAKEPDSKPNGPTGSSTRISAWRTLLWLLIIFHKLLT